MRTLLRVAVLVLGTGLAWPALADGSAGDNLFEALNTTGREAYGAARAEVIAPDQAVFLVTDKVTLLKGSEELGALPYTPLVYTQLKSVSHVSLGFFGACKGLLAHPQSPEWIARFDALRVAASEAQPNLAVSVLNETQRQRQEVLLKNSLTAIGEVISKKACSAELLESYMQSAAPILLANANDAAVAQIEMLDGAVKTLAEKLSADEWARALAVVTGPKMPRVDFLVSQYFAMAFNEDLNTSKRIIYTESVYDPDEALAILRVVLFDRGLGKIAFKDEGRMERDLLGDAARVELLRRFGKLGLSPSN
jgi:hypothetical protein